jgi:hypothetical protein
VAGSEYRGTREALAGNLHCIYLHLACIFKGIHFQTLHSYMHSFLNTGLPGAVPALRSHATPRSLSATGKKKKEKKKGEKRKTLSNTKSLNKSTDTQVSKDTHSPSDLRGN